MRGGPVFEERCLISLKNISLNSILSDEVKVVIKMLLEPKVEDVNLYQSSRRKESNDICPSKSQLWFPSYLA